MRDIEHPEITATIKTGYPKAVAQRDNFGIDVMGDEILAGDGYIVLPDGELLLESNVEDYQIEILGWKFKLAD